MVRTELRNLKGNMSQIMMKARELEGAMEEWTEQEGLEIHSKQDHEDSTPRQTRCTYARASEKKRRM